MSAQNAGRNASGKTPPRPPARPNSVSAARKRSPDPRFYGVLALIVLAGAAAIGYAATRKSAPDVSRIDPTMASKAEGYLLGKADAPVQILEFADFECPACGGFATVTEPDVRTRLVNTGVANVRFFDFPLPMHRNTWPASNAAACANVQGKFWPMHDSLFLNQTSWNGDATGNPKSVFKGYATQLGLDVGKWEQCYDEQQQLPRIQANAAEAQRRSINQTPTFIIGGRVRAGAMTYDQIKALVDTVHAEVAARGPAPAESGATRTVPVVPAAPGAQTKR